MNFVEGRQSRTSTPSGVSAPLTHHRFSANRHASMLVIFETEPAGNP